MTPSSTLPPALVDALAGTYELLQEIGRGGMGVVYAGRDIRLDRLVAIKVLPDLVSSDVVRERFLREARAAARLSHPSIVPIYSAEERGGVTFLVMAYVDGTTLSSRLRDGRALSAVDAVPILRDVALALGAAHARGVIHRDIKPENILIDRITGRAMVTDFGIARMADAMQSGALTRTGQVLGTVGYMSPEQVTGSDVDGRSDLYSLGVVAFEALAGKLPFDGPAPVVIVAHATKPAPALASVAPDTPAALCAIVDRLLKKSPDERYASGEALAAALEQAVGTSVAATPTHLAKEGEDRVLTEKEADRVWKRAAELQAGIGPATPRAPTAGVSIVPRTATSGFRLEHVRQAAVEAGISAAYVTLALDELLRRGTGAPAVAAAPRAPVDNASGRTSATVTQTNNGREWPLSGAPMSLVYEADVPGQLSPDDYDVIVHTIRSTFGEAGVATTLGRSLSWTTTSFNKTRRIYVSLSASGGRTHIRVEEKLGELAGMTYGGIVGGGGGGLGGASVGLSVAAFHVLGGVVFFLPFAIVAGAYGLARMVFTRSVANRSRELEQLVSRLAGQVTELVVADQAVRVLPR
jgi:hypothetical protein